MIVAATSTAPCDRRVDDLRETEVEQLDRAVGPQLDVRGLEVAVDDAVLVRGFERSSDLRGDREASATGTRPAREAIRQRLTLDELEHERLSIAFLDDVVQRRYVRMVQRGEHLRFARETREPVRSSLKRSGRTLSATSRPRRVSRAR